MKLERVQSRVLVKAEFDWQPFGALTPKGWLRLYLYAAMLVTDVCIILVAGIASNLLRFGAPLSPDGLNFPVVLAPFYVLMALHRHAYSADLATKWRSSAFQAVSSLLMATVAVVFLSFYLHASATVSREAVSLSVLIGCVLLTISRILCRRYSGRIFGGPISSEILICDGVPMPAVPGVHAIEAEAAGLTPDITDPFMLDRIGRLLKKTDRVIVACPPERRVSWALALKSFNISGELLTPELETLGALGACRYRDNPTLIVSTGPLDLRDRALKRILDLSIAVPSLIVLAPLMILVAIAIRLETPGPVFFLQPRLGRGNQLFNVFKFRSMRSDHCDAEGKISTQRNDKRITRVGRLIRATSIDELPQFLNVIKGDMSLVGPRPHALGSLAGDKLFWEVDQRYWHRHVTKPGITGLAQVRGFRGATHLQADLVNRLQADLAYLNGWTIWRDLQILVATAKVVFHKNAF